MPDSKSTVQTINPLHDSRWSDLVAGSPVGLFLSNRWMTVLSDTYGFEFQALAIEHDGELTAALPFCLVDDARGRRIRALPFCDLIEIPHSDPADAQTLLNHLAQMGLSTELITEAKNAPSGNPWETTDTHLWHDVVIGTHDRDSLLAACGSNTRNRIRKVEREGFRVWSDPDRAAIDEFFDLHLGVRKYRHELLPQPRSMFHSIADRFFVADDGWVVKVERDGELASAAVVLRHENALYYKFSASDPAYRSLGTNHAVAFGSLSLAMDLGCERVDLGRTPLAQPGLVSFKARLGARDRPMTRARIDGPVSEAEREAGATFGRLTKLFIDPAVPDSITEAAGAELYRFFA